MVETTRAIVGLVAHGTLTAASDADVIVPHCGALLPSILDRWELCATLRAEGGTDPQENGNRKVRGSTKETGFRSPAAALGRLWSDLAGTPMPHNAAALIERVGTDRSSAGATTASPPQARSDARSTPWTPAGPT